MKEVFSSIDDQITINLFELWREIGKLTGKLVETENYSTVSMSDSDWPNRIFDIESTEENFNKILQLSKTGKLPDIITLTKPTTLQNNSDYEFLFGQRNMALDLKSHQTNYTENTNIQQVKTEKDSHHFAITASASFGYKVDEKVVMNIVNSTENVRLYNYIKNNVCLGCGVIFFESKNNAGLHMIGTVPASRGHGVGKSMTEFLVQKAKLYKKGLCVLHASLMGENIYKKLGFEPYGYLETYRILKN